ncbi:hypothetical protein ACWFNS_09170 [Oerskovia enterophila]
MPKITEHYKITGPVPFVDVEVLSDNRLFVDPHAIRLSRSPSPFVSQAIECADTFCSEVTESVIARTPASYRQGEALLQRFMEPAETRLGMAATGFQGHGGSEGIGSLIWQTLMSDVEFLVRMGVLRQIEDLPVFVEGVDRDITSDITTRIIYHPLARFTEAMIHTYPQFTAGTNVAQTYSKQVWDPVAREWTTADVLLPVIDGKPVLLVPKGWARSTLLMSASRYYETSVLSFAQLEQSVIDTDGKLIKTPKWALRRQAGLKRGRTTSIRVTRRAFESEQDLLKHFKSFVASRLPASDVVTDTTAA